MDESGSHGNGGKEFELSEPVGSFMSTVRNVLLSPKDFFSGIPLRGSPKNPLTFGVACLLISGLLEGSINYLNFLGSESWITVTSLADQARNMGTGNILAFVLFGVVLAPLLVMLMSVLIVR